MEEKMNGLEYVIFIISIYELAKSYNFKLTTKDDSIEVVYPDASVEQKIEIVTFEEWAAFCTEILSWK